MLTFVPMNWISCIKLSSYLKIERVYQKNRIEYTFDVERLLLFLNENEIIISPLKNWRRDFAAIHL
jgi:integrase/recombinase XerD